MPDPAERGALGLGLPIGEVFGQEEQAILQRLLDNLELGLRSLRSQQELTQSEAKVRRMAYTDSLTGLANRGYLGKALNRRFQEATEPIQGALLFLDLDNFKLVNDGLGHAAGDLVLEQVARRLTRGLREEDLLARQGGDEFLILMEGAPRDRASTDAAIMEREELGEHVEALAGRIVATLEEPFAVAGHRYELGASIGISLYPHDGTDPAELIERADLTMFEAKGHGSRQPAWIFFATAISQKRRSRVTLESEFNKAFENQAFRLYYQPILNLRDRRVIAVEALIRWHREDGTLTLPEEFLPIAHESGLIEPLTDWVLGEADPADPPMAGGRAEPDGGGQSARGLSPATGSAGPDPAAGDGGSVPDRAGGYRGRDRPERRPAQQLVEPSLRSWLSVRHRRLRDGPG